MLSKADKNTNKDHTNFQFLGKNPWVQKPSSKTRRLTGCNFPSLLKDLDIFGIVLYSVLTFMATVSMLVFLEECIFIYKKVPANKKSVIIWVTGAAPVRMALWRTVACVGPVHCMLTWRFLSSRWLAPCRVWACGSPEPRCLQIWPLLGGSPSLCFS